MKAIKRNGSEVEFDVKKIENAIRKANMEVSNETDKIQEEDIRKIGCKIENFATTLSRALTVEEIQDMVEDGLMDYGKFNLARTYIKYRYKRELNRRANTTDNQIMSLIECANEEVKEENSNKNPILAPTQRDYMAGETSKDLSRRILLPPDVIKAHDEGVIHFHDMDYYSQHIHNCDLINLEDMLQNGTVISGTMIEKPKSFVTACTIATQIIAQVASSQYGGQSISLAHLAPFVDISRQKIRKQIIQEFNDVNIELSNDKLDQILKQRVKREIEKGIQTMQYQVVTLMTTNGQAPFITFFMYLDEVKEGQTRDDLAAIIQEVLKQRILGVKNEKGIYVTPAFPKLIYVLDEDNVYEGTKYFYLTKLAAKCSAKRMVPDYISAKVMKEMKQGNVYTCMGCRSFLTVEDSQRNPDGSHKFYGRFNQGVVTINLVDVACSSNGDLDAFWKIFDERLELCHKALRCRHERLKGTKSDIAPILWQYGALARLKKGETIDKLLYDGYSTISLGYAGLCECCYRMFNKPHTDKSVSEFSLKVMQRLNDKCAEWKEAENIAYSVYGTPLESTTYKFAKCLQNRFGIIEHVTDKNYITNSYHVHVTEEIDAFSKLTFESQYQKLSPGGAISYVEVPNMQNNLEAVVAIMQHIYNTIMYAELNTKSDYCEECGYEGEIQIVEDNGKLIWECPNCGCRDQSHMSVARRTCGYIGTQYWNQGRTAEIKDRVIHVSVSENKL